MARRLILCLLIVFAGLHGVNALTPPALERYAFSEPHMGTLFKVVLYAPDETTAKKAATAAFARVAELNRIMSDYLPDSELMRLCKQAGGPPMEVSRELFDILQQAEKFSEMTGGAFDVTVGPVVRLWRRARRSGQLPAAEELKKALALVDFHKIRLDANGRRVQLLLAGMLIDLGSIAKGYAADAALAVLRRQGLTRALVAAGGDIAVGDAPPDAPGWKVGIAPLKSPDAPPTRYLLLSNAGVSTAGDSEQFVKIEGKRYSHIIDPTTGLGLIGRRSVTVIAANATTSDALDTAIAVMGRERGLQFAERHGIAAVLTFETERGVETTMTTKFAKYEYKTATD
jgi:FAD:protein FMN transferase